MARRVRTLNEEALIDAIDAARDTVEIDPGYEDEYSRSSPWVENWGDTVTAAISAYLNSLEAQIGDQD